MSLKRMLKFTETLRDRGRIRVARMAEEMDVPRRTVYRYIQAASENMPLRLEEGVIILQGRNDDDKPDI